MYMNVVWFDIWVVCCMLWVMIIMVNLFFKLLISFLIIKVEIGLSVDVGLFRSNILGLIVIEWVIIRCCCWLFDRLNVLLCKWFLILFYNVVLCKDCLIILFSLCFFLIFCKCRL